MTRAYELYNYQATVTRIVDGDTFYAHIDRGMREYREERLRLLNGDLKGVNCPEKNDKDPAVRARAYAADARTRELLPIGGIVLIHTEKDEDFGRWLASVRLPDGRDLGDLLLAEGHAVPYVRK